MRFGYSTILKMGINRQISILAKGVYTLQGIMQNREV